MSDTTETYTTPPTNGDPEPIEAFPTEEPNHLSLKSEIITELESALSGEPEVAQAIKDIGVQIATTGMSIEDCCLMADFSFSRLQEYMKSIPSIEIFFNIKRTKYKSDLLSILHNHAREAGDHKLALQLLSLGFSDEYDASVKKEKAKKSRENNNDILASLVKRVQKGAPTSPVNEKLNVSEAEKQAKKDVYELSHLVHGEE